MTSAQDGKLDLDVPVSDKFLGLKSVFNPSVAANMTVRDMASHCVGLDQLLYEVVGKQCVVTSQLTGKTLGTLVKDEIFIRLGMDRSYFRYPPDENYAIPYLVFDDRSPEAKPLPAFVDGDAFDSSGSMRPCVKYMLASVETLIKPIYSAFLDLLAILLVHWQAIRLNKFFRIICTKRLRQFRSHTFLSPKMTSKKINTVTNVDVISNAYVLWHESKPRPAIGHTGEYGGLLPVYWTFPEDEAAIVVLCNSFEVNGDPTNIIAQLIGQELFDLKPKVDFTQVTKEIAANAQKRWTSLRKDWESHREQDTQPVALSSYSGKIKHDGLNMNL
ncbi:hypothetical protein ACHAPJ_012082 [Fusarium lateritium]